MSAGTYSIGLSALFSAQQALATTSHNIANVNTEGFSRQRVTMETRQAQFIGFGYVGKGVDVQSILRLSDQFLVDQVRNSSSNAAQAGKLVNLVDQVDRQFGDALVAGGMQAFFGAIGDANDDPRLSATRQVLLESARTMIGRFADEEAQLNDYSRSVNRQISSKVDEINALTAAIANINVDIARGVGLAAGAPDNDLLDKRDQLLVNLSLRIGVQIQTSTDGMVNVLVGDGQLVVAGGNQSRLKADPNPLDASRLEVALEVGSTLAPITAQVRGGELGALVEFRDTILDPARNAIGRLAATIALTVNEQHRNGMDLNGQLGGNLFVTPVPTVHSGVTNTGTISVAFDAANVSAITTSDYRLRHDGTNLTLTRMSDGFAQNLVGAGPFSVDGLTITLTSPAAANDDYLLEPTKFVPRSMKLATNDPAAIALASPVRSAAAIANISEATITPPQVLDATDLALLAPTQLVFNDPPTTFQVNGAGPLLAFSGGADIDINGWRVQVNGQPQAGDTFLIESNAGGIGDNRNGLALSQLQFAALMAGGTASYQEAYGAAVGAVGSKAAQARISNDAFTVLNQNAQAARDQLSGVNLDEEAANLLRFQQAYQAAAQVIAAADATFQALLQATGN